MRETQNRPQIRHVSIGSILLVAQIDHDQTMPSTPNITHRDATGLRQKFSKWPTFLVVALKLIIRRIMRLVSTVLLSYAFPKNVITCQMSIC